MKIFALTLAATGMLVLASDPAMAYWNAPFMGPPPVPPPPAGFPSPFSSPWDMNERAFNEQSQAAGHEQSDAEGNAVKALESELRAARKALNNLRNSRKRLLRQCRTQTLRSREPKPVTAGPSEQSVPAGDSRLSEELSAARAELTRGGRRIDQLTKERDQLRAQLRSGMGERVSIQNAFEQVRKRAVGLDSALRESRGTGVGAEIERDLLKAELDRLIAALALANAVLAEPGDSEPAISATAGTSRKMGGLSAKTAKSTLTKAAGFEPAL